MFNELPVFTCYRDMVHISVYHEVQHSVSQLHLIWHRNMKPWSKFGLLVGQVIEEVFSLQ